ncbi:MAG: TetR/AcrR family transcriptional regulator [Chloroflexi bacterium]|jgi:AcrR family transcriptional regulator|nr:TetR/AcrR family transcriptional regulator [Chloroflexota bacterium]
MIDDRSKGDVARAEIMDAARQLFLLQGYNGTSMRAIAQAAGNRAVAGLYNHFPTKEAIFRALIEEQNPYGALLGILNNAQGETAEAYIRSALTDILIVMPQYYDFFQLALIDLREFEGRHVAQVLSEKVFPQVIGVIVRLQALPGLKPLDGVVLVRLMASLVVGYIVTRNIAPGMTFEQLPHEVWSRQFIDALLYGIMDDDARE